MMWVSRSRNTANFGVGKWPPSVRLESNPKMDQKSKFFAVVAHLLNQNCSNYSPLSRKDVVFFWTRLWRTSKKNLRVLIWRIFFWMICPWNFTSLFVGWCFPLHFNTPTQQGRGKGSANFRGCLWREFKRHIAFFPLFFLTHHFLFDARHKKVLPGKMFVWFSWHNLRPQGPVFFRGASRGEGA